MVRSNKLQPQTLSGSPSSQFTDYSPDAIVADRAPTTSDIGYELGQSWIHRGVGEYVLIQVAGGIATWEATGGGVTSLSTLTGDGATIATPVGSNITIAGAGVDGLTFTGGVGTLTPSVAQSTTAQRGTLETATNAEAAALTSTTVAITPSNLPQIMTSQFIVGPVNAPYTTIQSAVTAAETAGGNQIVFVRPGSYTEDVTFSTGTVDLIGICPNSEDGIVTITGTHIAPSSGHLSFSNFRFIDNSVILMSGAAGTASISFVNCAFNITAGLICNLQSWTGNIKFEECQDESTNNSIIQSTIGAANVTILNSILGKGVGFSLYRGATIIQNSTIGCPMQIFGSPFNFSSSQFLGEIAPGVAATGTIYNCSIITGAQVAFTQNSTNSTTISQCIIDSSADPCIQGSMPGQVIISDVSFLDNSNIAVGVVTVGKIIKGGNFVSQFIAGEPPDATYSTIQAALDAANALGGGTVIVKNNFQEDLVLYDNTQIVGVSDNFSSNFPPNIIGVHTPPETGKFKFSGVQLTSATHIFSSSEAGSATLEIEDCLITIDTGFTFNLPNWTGKLTSTNCSAVDCIANGEVNNEGMSPLFYKNTNFGFGASTTASFNGNGDFNNVVFSCPVNIEGSSQSTFYGGSAAAFTINCLDTSASKFYNMSFFTGANSALNITSFGIQTISDTTIDCSASLAIDGDSNGILFIGSVSFIDSFAIQSLLTLGEGSPMLHTVNNLEVLGGQICNYTNVTTTPYSVLNTDYFLSIDTSVGALTVELPDPNFDGQVFIVKDRDGLAATSNISVTTTSGMATIDGATTYTINQNYAAFSFLDNGTNYEVF